MSIKSIVKINENVNVDSKPKGWVVRELINKETNRVIVLELGIYVSEDRFLGVPIHYSFKDKLVPMRYTSNDEYTYYLLNTDAEFSIGTFKTKKDKILPMLMPPSDKYPAVKVACIAYAPDGNEKVIHAALTRDDNVVLKEFIDKDRKSIALIAACKDPKVVNPAIDLSVESGVIGSKLLTKKTFNITISPVIDTNVETLTEPAKTEFIKFKKFIRTPRPKTTEEQTEKSTDEINAGRTQK